ncbi:hypothetical protein TWF696_002404 [Orbilia brochopaga]|uniref:Uncharacterized protein n=1 Tax=Orbilia brochopaga TaxID=3140254 RepID=A0AAV9U496_9PEZI
MEAKIAGMLGNAGAKILSSIISNKLLNLISGPSPTEEDLTTILQELKQITQSLSDIAASVSQSILDTITATAKKDLSDIATYLNRMQDIIQIMHDTPNDSGLADEIDTFCGVINTHALQKAQEIHDGLTVGTGGPSALQQMWINISESSAGALPFDPVEAYKKIKYLSLNFEAGLRNAIALLTFQWKHDSANPQRQARAQEAQANIDTVTSLITNWDTILEAPAPPAPVPPASAVIIPPSIQQMAQAWLPDDQAQTPLVLAWDRYLSTPPYYGVEMVIGPGVTPFFDTALELQNALCNDPNDAPMCFSFYRNNADATYKIRASDPPPGTPSVASDNSPGNNYLGLYRYGYANGLTWFTLVMPIVNSLPPQAPPSFPVSQEWFQIQMLPDTFDGEVFNCVMIVAPSDTVPPQSPGSGLVVNALYGGEGEHPDNYRLLCVNSCSTDTDGLADLGSDYIWRLRSPSTPP